MNTLTYSGKTRLASRPFGALFTLLALFVGLGMSRPVLGQPSSIGSTRSVIVDTGTGGENFDAVPDVATGATPPASVFDERNFGTFDFSTGRIILNGGSFTVNERNGDVFTDGFIDFRVSPGTITPPPTAFQASPTGSVQLRNDGVVGGVRTFSLTSASEDILRRATAGGAGTSYRFDVTFRAVGLDINGFPRTIDRDANGDFPIRRSQFTATGTPPLPPPNAMSQITLQTITLTRTVPGPTAVMTLNQAPTTAGPNNFQGTDFGTFDVDAGELLLNGAAIDVQVNNGEVYNSASLDFRVFQGDLNSTLQPGFTTLALQPVGTAPVNGVRSFRLTTEQINIIQLAIGDNNANKTFRFDTRLRVNGNDAFGQALALGGAPRQSTFTVTGSVPAPATDTQWKGVNDNWFNPQNWTNGVPTPDVNAIIPDFGSESAAAIYPNIRESQAPLVGGVRQSAQCRDLTMNGSTQLNRSICRLVTGELDVHGNFNNVFDSFIQRTEPGDFSVLVFAGRRSQNISGGRFTTIHIRGLGDKRIIGRMSVQVELRFFANSGNVVTDIARPTTSLVELSDRSDLNAQQGAQLVNETDDSKIVGFVETTRSNVRNNEGNFRTFGNIGMELNFTGSNDNPGNVTVTRNTAENYAPVSGRFGAQRVFGVRPTTSGAQFGDLSATMRFLYLKGETINLRTDPNTPSTQRGNGVLNESTLAIYLSTNSGNSFTKLGQDGRTPATPGAVFPADPRGVVVKTVVKSFATFTIADENNATGLPLPVELTAFNVRKSGNDALLTWTTATEKNNKGFDVEVSKDGQSFSSIGFVASASADGNSVRSLSYQFTDNTANKAGNRYYRLRQTDFDGKTSLSVVRTLTFETNVAATPTLLAYPNPFTSAVKVAVVGAGAGRATLRLSDLTGRTIQTQQVQLETGSTVVELNNLDNLTAGIYMVQLVLPSGKTQNFKVQKL